MLDILTNVFAIICYVISFQSIVIIRTLLVLPYHIPEVEMSKWPWSTADNTNYSSFSEGYKTPPMPAVMPPKREGVTTKELLELYPDLAELYNKYLTFEILKRGVPESNYGVVFNDGVVFNYSDYSIAAGANNGEE